MPEALRDRGPLRGVGDGEGPGATPEAYDMAVIYWRNQDLLRYVLPASPCNLRCEASPQQLLSSVMP